MLEFNGQNNPQHPWSEADVTRQVYNGVGQMIEMIAENSSTNDQTTRYEYGVTLANSGSANNNALRKVIHPDEGEVIYSYNRAGQQTSMTDQNGYDLDPGSKLSGCMSRVAGASDRFANSLFQRRLL